VPAAFRLDDVAAWAVVEEAGAGFVVTSGPGGVASVYVPVLVSEDRSTLRCHVARANGWWRALGDGAEVVALFVTASSYVSPAYYPSRGEEPGVVPTWNYVAAEVRGRAHVTNDDEWLATQVTDLTNRFEEGRDPRWWVGDAPEEYLARQRRAIVGVVVDVHGIEGKAKLSQNRSDVDARSVADHLGRGSESERNVARRMPPRG